MNRTPGGTDDAVVEHPCRAAARYMTECPLCGRCVNLKTLTYTHVCAKRTREVTARAIEQQTVAHAAIKAWATGGTAAQATENPKIEQRVERRAETRGYGSVFNL